MLTGIIMSLRRLCGGDGQLLHLVTSIILMVRGHHTWCLIVPDIMLSAITRPVPILAVSCKCTLTPRHLIGIMWCLPTVFRALAFEAMSGWSVPSCVPARPLVCRVVWPPQRSPVMAVCVLPPIGPAVISMWDTIALISWVTTIGVGRLRARL